MLLIEVNSGPALCRHGKVLEVMIPRLIEEVEHPTCHLPLATCTRCLLTSRLLLAACSLSAWYLRATCLVLA